MKILLATPPGKTTERWPPLGLLYIASCVRELRGDEIKVIDAFCENLAPRELAARVLREKPDVFGINCSTHTFLAAIDALQRIHRTCPETVLVMGGFHATFAAEQILRDYPFVDYVIKGEAERTFPKFLECLENGSAPSAVPGTSYLEDGHLVSMPAAVTEDLDALPLPARELVSHIDYGYHHQNIRLTFGKFTTLCSSRGCPFECTYCSCAAFSRRKWRPRSAASVVDELETLQGEGYKSAVFVDDNFTLKKSRVIEICDRIRDRGIRMRLYCEGRVDNAPYPLLKAMKRAGFEVIYFGVESASQHVLDYYKKGITPAESSKAVADAKRAGMLVVASFIVGAPVESEEDMQRTVDFIRDNRPHGVQMNILDCLIGTPIWDGLVEKGIVGQDDWKRNHRIYEYHGDGLSQEALEAVTARGYDAHLQGWKNLSGLRELLKILWSNRSARKVVFGNILNEDVRTRLREGYHPRST